MMIQTTVGKQTDTEFYNKVRKLHLSLLDIEEGINVYRDHKEANKLMLDVLQLNIGLMGFYKSITGKDFSY